jgi:hypothetical protein
MTLKNMDHWRRSLEAESPELAKRLARGSLREEGTTSASEFGSKSSYSDSALPIPSALTTTTTATTDPINPKSIAKTTDEEPRKARSYSASEVLKGTIRKVRGTFKSKKQKDTSSESETEKPPVAAELSIFDLADQESPQPSQTSPDMPRDPARKNG